MRQTHTHIGNSFWIKTDPPSQPTWMLKGNILCTFGKCYTCIQEFAWLSKHAIHFHSGWRLMNAVGWETVSSLHFRQGMYNSCKINMKSTFLMISVWDLDKTRAVIDVSVYALKILTNWEFSSWAKDELVEEIHQLKPCSLCLCDHTWVRLLHNFSTSINTESLLSQHWERTSSLNLYESMNNIMEPLCSGLIIFQYVLETIINILPTIPIVQVSGLCRTYYWLGCPFYE